MEAYFHKIKNQETPNHHFMGPFYFFPSKATSSRPHFEPVLFFSKQGYFLPPPFSFFPSKATSSRPHFQQKGPFSGLRPSIWPFFLKIGRSEGPSGPSRGPHGPSWGPRRGPQMGHEGREMGLRALRALHPITPPTTLLGGLRRPSGPPHTTLQGGVF